MSRTFESIARIALIISGRGILIFVSIISQLYALRKSTSCTFSGLLILEARLAALPLLSDTETAENRFSSSDISISGALVWLSCLGESAHKLPCIALVTFTQCKGFNEAFFGGIDEPVVVRPLKGPSEVRPLPEVGGGGGGASEPLVPTGGGGAAAAPRPGSGGALGGFGACGGGGTIAP